MAGAVQEGSDRYIPPGLGADSIANASGLFVDTSSAFTNPLLGTRKDDPKARYSLVAQAIEAFESQSFSSHLPLFSCP